MTAATIEPWEVDGTLAGATGLDPAHPAKFPKAVAVTCPRCYKSVAEVYAVSAGFYFRGWAKPDARRVRSDAAAVGQMITGDHASDLSDLIGECRSGHGVWELDVDRILERIEQYRRRNRTHRVPATDVGRLLT